MHISISNCYDNFSLDQLPLLEDLLEDGDLLCLLLLRLSGVLDRFRFSKAISLLPYISFSWGCASGASCPSWESSISICGPWTCGSGLGSLLSSCRLNNRQLTSALLALPREVAEPAARVAALAEINLSLLFVLPAAVVALVGHRDLLAPELGAVQSEYGVRYAFTASEVSVPCR